MILAPFGKEEPDPVRLLLLLLYTLSCVLGRLQVYF